MTTEYRVRLDRRACEGVFACLVRDERFVEASDGLATIGEEADGEADELAVTFADDRLADARRAARACPLDAITVSAEGDDE